MCRTLLKGHTQTKQSRLGVSLQKKKRGEMPLPMLNSTHSYLGGLKYLEQEVEYDRPSLNPFWSLYSIDMLEITEETTRD